MKILWFTNIMLPELAIAIGRPALNQGGWLPALVQSLRLFAPDVDLTVACAGQDSQEADVSGVKYVQIDVRNGLANAASILLDKVKPDIVHIHGTEGVWSNLLRETFRGCHVVASLQGVVSGCYPHYSGNLAASETFSVRNIPNMLITRYWIARAARIWRTKLSIREQSAFKNFDAFLGRTEWDKAWTKYLNPDAKYYHVGEILRSPFYRGCRSEDSVVPRTIFCGAAFGYPLKGGHWLLRAVAALKRKYPEVQLRVANARKAERPRTLISSLRQGEYHRYLSRLIRNLDIENNVVLLPSLTAEEVAEELRRAEVFCLPSLCENSPNSLGEAMLMGCPCVATDVGGVQTILKNREQGILVPAADPAVLAHEIAHMFDDKSLALRYARAGYKVAVSRYAPEKVVGELISAYKGVLHK